MIETKVTITYLLNIITENGIYGTKQLILEYNKLIKLSVRPQKGDTITIDRTNKIHRQNGFVITEIKLTPITKKTDTGIEICHSKEIRLNESRKNGEYCNNDNFIEFNNKASYEMIAETIKQLHQGWYLDHTEQDWTSTIETNKHI